MNENIDLTKILEGCPVGTKFYHLMFGKVYFMGIDMHYISYPIRFRVVNATSYDVGGVTREGLSNKHYNGECLLVPSKDQRDWSKFVRFWGKLKAKRFDPKTFQPFDKVLVRDDDGCTWRCGFFSHLALDDFDKEVVRTTDVLSVRCIPYNEEIKHLVGTTDDCPDFYKWWEE